MKKLYNIQKNYNNIKYTLQNILLIQINRDF